MAPPSTSAARRVASSRVAPIPDAARPNAHRSKSYRRVAPLASAARVVKYLPAIMVVVALLVVVAGQAMLANGQVRMAGLDQQLQAAKASHSEQVERVSKLETPSRIVRDATASGNMTRPSHVTQLPYVPLNTPLAAPNVTAAPGSSATATTTPAVSQ